MSTHNIEAIAQQSQIRPQQAMSFGFDIVNDQYSAIAVNDDGLQAVRNYYWNTDSLAWEVMGVAQMTGGFELPAFDEMELGYTVDDLTSVT